MKRFTILITVAAMFMFCTPAYAVDAAPKTDAAALASVSPVNLTTEAPKEALKVDVPAPAPQAEVQQVVWWKVLVQHAMELGFLILTLMATVFVRVLGKKYGFAAYTDQVNSVLEKATNYAEQKAVAAAKLEEGKVTSGAEKMKLAISFAQKLGEDYKIKNKGEEWWEDQLEAWLGVVKK